jgi:ATP-dependent Lon protease
MPSGFENTWQFPGTY